MTVPMTIFLETPRLIVKAPVQSDFDAWYTLHLESDVMQASEQTIQQWLDSHIADYEKYGFSMGSVFLKTTHQFIGRAGLFYYPDSEKKDIEIGYILHKAHWNKGYATELVHALLEWGFEHLDSDRIIALTRLDNEKSQHILKKVGMRTVEQVESEGTNFLLHEIKIARRLG